MLFTTMRLITLSKNEIIGRLTPINFKIIVDDRKISRLFFCLFSKLDFVNAPLNVETYRGSFFI
jgi:hypothetical protein